MDIKARIDSLTEAETKAALGKLLETVSILEPCRLEFSKYCPHYDECDATGTRRCAEIWLDEALKEARE